MSHFTSHPRAIYQRNMQSIPTTQVLLPQLESSPNNNDTTTILQLECAHLRDTISRLQLTINKLSNENANLINLNNQLLAQQSNYNAPPLEPSAPPAYNSIYSNI